MQFHFHECSSFSIQIKKLHILIIHSTSLIAPFPIHPILCLCFLWSILQFYSFPLLFTIDLSHSYLFICLNFAYIRISTNLFFSAFLLISIHRFKLLDALSYYNLDDLLLAIIYIVLSVHPQTYQSFFSSFFILILISFLKRLVIILFLLPFISFSLHPKNHLYHQNIHCYYFFCNNLICSSISIFLNYFQIPWKYTLLNRRTPYLIVKKSKAKDRKQLRKLLSKERASKQ